MTSLFSNRMDIYSISLFVFQYLGKLPGTITITYIVTKLLELIIDSIILIKVEFIRIENHFLCFCVNDIEVLKSSTHKNVSINTGTVGSYHAILKKCTIKLESNFRRVYFVRIGIATYRCDILRKVQIIFFAP